MDPLDGLEQHFHHTQTLMAMIALKRAIKGCANEPIYMVDANKTSSNPFLRAGVWCVNAFCSKQEKLLHSGNPLYHFGTVFHSQLPQFPQFSHLNFRVEFN